MSDYSMNPEGEKFQLPSQEEYAKELKRVESLAEAARKEGKEIVVVMGVGFVGAVMAAIIASGYSYFDYHKIRKAHETRNFRARAKNKG